MGRENKVGLAENLGSSRTTLWRRFLPFWDIVISPKEVNKLFPLKHKEGEIWVLGLDGMWLHRFGEVMIYRDVTSGENLYWSWVSSESYQNLSDDFYQVYLLTLGNPPVGGVSDWKGAIVSLFPVFFGEIPHQRCLAHLLREGKRLLPAGSPNPFTLELRKIVEEIIFIKEPSDYYDWSKKLERWQKRFGHLLRERSTNPDTEKKWWYTHGNLRRAIRILTKDQDSLFQFLHYNFLPSTNNSLEGVNSQTKQKLGAHRGMKVNQQISFVFWLLAFKRTKTKADLKMLWDEIKPRL